MKEWIDFLASYPLWIKIFVVCSFGVSILLLVAFRPQADKKPTTMTFTATVVDASDPTKAIRGASVSLNYKGIPRVANTDDHGVSIYTLETKDLPLTTLIQVESPGFRSQQRNVQIDDFRNSERFQLLAEPSPAPAPSRTDDADDQDSRKAIKSIVSGCNRRSVFTTMHAQINRNAMYESLDQCREIVQSNRSLINQPRLSQIAADILGALDSIERTKGSDSPDVHKEIDRFKQSIVDGLNELSKSVKLPFTIPKKLTQSDYYLNLKDANRAPGSPDHTN